ncbi:MAG: phosphopantothenoylcysteine decarboxylase [Ilumatobacteraceae bacterium]
MHTEMWENPAVQDNLATLRRRGVQVVEPERPARRRLEEGAGSPHPNGSSPRSSVCSAKDLVGVHVVVSAGGTREPIDAVRVVANRSSGKQGYAIAAEALARGARVTLVTTVELPLPPGAVARPVETAAEMQAALDDLAPTADVVVMAAAVADFRPVHAADGKIKKEMGVPRSCSSRPPTSSPASAPPSVPARCSSWLRCRDERSDRERRVEAASQEPRPDRRERRERVRRRLPARHQCGHHRARRWRHDHRVAHRQARSHVPYWIACATSGRR